MSSRLDISLIVKVAKMYYLDGLKQEDIAKQIGISRSLISMILTEAKERGIVEITVRDPSLTDEELSKKLEASYPGIDFIVIPTSSRDPDALRKLVAQRAADLLCRIMKDGQAVGLAWGRTCLELVNACDGPVAARDISIVPLIGGSAQRAPYFQINEMVRLLADKCGGSPFFIHAPALVSGPEERDMYLSSSSMQAIREKWERLDILVTGIGALPSPKPLDRENYIGEHEIYLQLVGKHAVGDICARYFDAAGSFIADELLERVVGIPVAKLRTAKNAICMASCADKVEAIIGALHTGVVKTLVIDEPTARTVIGTLSERPSADASS
jgi:DNA-binding transcriptional regulator LsrR (DeoR family)